MISGRVVPSQRAKDHLIKLKRLTGLQHWNELCRWGFCVSLAESTPPSRGSDSPESSIQMSWHQFGGEYHAIFTALLKERCKQDGLEINDATLTQQFRLHLHRGLSYLASDRDIKNIADLLGRLPLND